jgi:hypothetical protein
MGLRTYAAGVPERPIALEVLDRQLATSTVAHEYVGDLYRELVDVGAEDEHATELLRESADIALRRMPLVTRDLSRLERAWLEQELLDELHAGRPAIEIEAEFDRVLPELSMLLSRQRQVAAEMRELVRRARR